MVKSTGTSIASELIYLLPDDIIRDEINVRPGWEPETEIEGIEELARSIEAVGQILPVKVRVVSNGADSPAKYHLVDGRRRVAAVEWINAQKTAKEQPLKITAVSEAGVDDNAAFRQAMMANMKRKDFSPMDIAKDIQEIRTRMGLVEGAKGTKKVAEFLGVSPAYVTTHESLLKLDEESQGKVHRGLMSREAAFELLNVKPEERQKVQESAEELRKRELLEASDSTGDVDEGEGEARGKGKRKKTPKQVAARHIRQASRQHAAAISLRPLSRTEIVGFWQKLDGPEFGYHDGLLRKFIRSVVMWTEGKIKDSTLAEYFARVTEKADRGKPNPHIKEEKEAAKAGRTVKKKAKTPAPKNKK